MTIDYIQNLELKIVNALKWSLTVPTLNNWMGIYTHEFDSFLIKSGHPDLCYRECMEGCFKNLNDLGMVMDCLHLIVEI